jgi:hypothetical protein
MKFKKLAIAAAIVGAFGAGTVSAGVTGVPADANLVPLVLNSDANAADAQIETYVGLYVPEEIGADTIISNFTARNSAPTARPQVLPSGGNPANPLPPYIYWALVDEDSELVDDGECEISLGDKVVWSTDVTTYRALQQQQNAALQSLNVFAPNPVCGPSGSSERFGYVVFQTPGGADGCAADFAFWGNAWILDQGTISATGNSIAAVPVIPLSDGPDTVQTQPTLIGNEVITSGSAAGYQCGLSPTPPASVAPIFAGIRMNNSIAPTDEQVLLQAEIRGPATGFEQSLHAFWFDQNNANREAKMIVWDDAEGSCTDSLPMPREVNLWLYNHNVQVGGFPAVSGWGNLIGQNAANVPGFGPWVTSVIDAVKPGILTGYNSTQLCAPDYWEANPNSVPAYIGALNGYVQYAINEEGTGQGVGLVDRGAIAFNWQEALGVADSTGVASGWSTHMTTDLGKR